MHFFKHRAFLHGGQTRRNTLSGGAASPLARALISPDKLLRVATAAGRRQEYYSECVPLKIRSNPDSEESLHLPRQTDSGDGPVHFDDIVSQSSQPSDSAKPRPYVAVEASVPSIPLLPGIEFSTAARIRTRSAATAISIANRGDFIASLKESVASMMPSRSEIITTFLPLHDTWRLQSWRSRLVSVLSLPCIWMLSLTVVVVDLPDDSANDQQPQQPKDESVRLLNDGNNNKNGDDDDYADDNAAIDSDVDSQIVLNPDRWPKWLVLTNCLTAPIFIALGVGVWEEPVGSEPNFTWGLTACLFSLVLFTLTALTSKASRPPKWFKVCLNLSKFCIH
jgi:hypothetical protein